MMKERQMHFCNSNNSVLIPEPDGAIIDEDASSFLQGENECIIALLIKVTAAAGAGSLYI